MRINRLRRLLEASERRLAKEYEFRDHSVRLIGTVDEAHRALAYQLRKLEARHDAILDELRALGVDNDPVGTGS